MLAGELRRSQRYSLALSLLLLDVDNFKSINDKYGHIAGDNVLKRLATTFESAIRTSDFIARWGGEEFLSMLSDTPLEGGRIFAERVLSEVHQAFPDGSVTLSAGVARCTDGMDTPTRLLAAADEAMYEAKAAGGDCVRVANETLRAKGP